MNQIFVLHYQRGRAWQEGKSIFEQGLQDHRLYMRGLAEAKTVLIGGPFLDDRGGLVIVQVKGEDEARAIGERDPAVVAGVMRVVQHPWHVLAGAPALAAAAA